MRTKLNTYLLCFVCCLLSLCLLPLSAYAEDLEKDRKAWVNVFESRTDYQTISSAYSPNKSPESFSPNGLNTDYTYCFCAGRTNNGIMLFTDSDTLIATGNANYTSVSLSVPYGKHMQGFYYSYDSSGNYTVRSTSTHDWSTGYQLNGEYWGNLIYRNDCFITDSFGIQITEPLRDEQFTLTTTVNSDYSITSEVTCTYDSGNFRAEWFICPSSGSPSFSVDSAFYALKRLATLSPDSPEYHQTLLSMFSSYPLLEDSGLQHIYSYIVSQHTNIVDDPLAPTVDFFSNLSTYFDIKANAYNGYRGFDYGRFNYNYGKSTTFSVVSFYNNCHNMAKYTDVNTIYCCIFLDSDEGQNAPVAILGANFRASDFFPDFVLPDLAPDMPSMDIIDDEPSLPSGGTDWSIYQHAMYMRVLANQLSDNLRVSVNTSYNLPDADYAYDASDIVPYDFDVDMPDVSAPDGVPLDLVRPVTLFGTLWTNILDSTGLSIIVPWCMIIALVAWFFYGNK